MAFMSGMLCLLTKHDKQKICLFKIIACSAQTSEPQLTQAPKAGISQGLETNIPLVLLHFAIIIS
jgi:hypothetical protein